MNERELREKGKVPGPETGIEIRKSICTICDPTTQCGLDLFVKDGKIIRVEGSKEAPHSHGSLCSKGAATRQYVYSPDRLKTPLRRVGERGEGKFEPISWDEALDEIGQEPQRREGAVRPGVGHLLRGLPKAPQGVLAAPCHELWLAELLYRVEHVLDGNHHGPAAHLWCTRGPGQWRVGLHADVVHQSRRPQRRSYAKGCSIV